MSRTTVKRAVASVLEQHVTALRGVFTGEPKEIQQQQMPCVVITIPDQEEDRHTTGAPRGKKHIEYTVQLKVFTIDVSNDALVGEVQYDQLLDDIDAALRQYPQLDGSVLKAAQSFIRTDVAQPQLLEGRTVARLAIKKFDVTEQVIG